MLTGPQTRAILPFTCTRRVPVEPCSPTYQDPSYLGAFMFKLILRLGLSAASIGLTAHFLDGMEVKSVGGALTAAFVLGLLNLLVKPLLKLLSLPLTLLTLGLFSLVINGVILALTAYFVEALVVDSFGTAIVGALSITVVHWLLSLFFDRDD